MIRPSYIPAVLVALALGAGAFEIANNPGLHKLPWSDLGLRRLLVYAAAFVAVAVLRRILRAPLWPYFLALAGAYGVAVVGIAPFAACAFFALSATALGGMVFRDSLRKSAGEAVYCFCLGEGLLGFAFCLFGRTYLCYPAVFLFLLLLPVVVQWRWLALRAFALWRAVWDSASPEDETWPATLLVFAVGIQFLLVLKPEVGTDSLAMHLALPAYVAIHHHWPFDVHDFLWAVMPQTADWCYTAAYSLGGEYAARLLNFVNLTAALGILWSLTQRCSSRAAALLVCALFAAGPMAQVTTGSLFIENALAAMLIASVGAFWLFVETGIAALWAGAWLLFGCALSTKAGALAFLPGVIALAAYGSWRYPGRLWLRTAWAAGGIAIGAYIYLLALAKTGNPFFPTANEIFHSKLIPPERLAEQFRHPLKWRTLADLTFHSSEFIEGTDGASGFQYFLLLPAALVTLALRRRPAIAWLTMVGLSAGLAAYLQIAYLRYLYPSMLLLMAPMAWWFDKERQGARWQRWLAYSTVSVAFAANILFQASSGWYHRDFVWDQIGHPEGAAEYLEASAPARMIVEKLNRVAPGEPALFCQYDHVAGLQGAAYSTNWHMYLRHDGLLNFREGIDVLDYVNRRGIRYIAAPCPEDLDTWPRVLPVFFDDFTERVFAPGRWVLYRVKPEFAGAAGLDTARRWSANPPPAGSGIYDDADVRAVRDGGWFHDYCCSDAFARSLSTSRKAGDALRFAFLGTKADVLFPRGPNFGIAEVRLDGVPRPPIDEYAAAPRYRERLTLNASGAGVHAIEVRVSGHKNAASSDPNIAVDGFQIWP